MKFKVLVLFVLFFKIFSVFSLDSITYQIDITKEIKLQDDHFILIDYETGKQENSYVIKDSCFSVLYDSGLTYFVLDNSEKYLILKNEDLLVVYDGKKSEPEYIATSFNAEFFSRLSLFGIKATSSLKEGNKIYDERNLSNLFLDSPWVEGCEESGIGEKIEFNSNGKIIYIFNGYVSFSKPYLYKANNRVKKIKISSVDGKFDDIYFSLQDTPNPQAIEIPERNTKVIIEILDVYKGEKYDDTCINGIVFKVF